MDDILIKAFLTVAVVYAAVNPLFRHHNLAEPVDVAAVMILVLAGILTIGNDDAYPFVIVLGVLLFLLLIDRIVFGLLHRRYLIIFGAGARNRSVVAASLSSVLEKRGINPEQFTISSRHPWLLLAKDVSATTVTGFMKSFDKDLRAVLGIEFRRLYPAAILALAFLAALWRYL
jgi:hypothetical protein